MLVGGFGESEDTSKESTRRPSALTVSSDVDQCILAY